MEKKRNQRRDKENNMQKRARDRAGHLGESGPWCSASCLWGRFARQCWNPIHNVALREAHGTDCSFLLGKVTGLARWRVTRWQMEELCEIKKRNSARTPAHFHTHTFCLFHTHNTHTHLVQLCLMLFFFAYCFLYLSFVFFVLPTIFLSKFSYNHVINSVNFFNWSPALRFFPPSHLPGFLLINEESIRQFSPQGVSDRFERI